MQCLISSCIIFKLVTILKWKVNFSFLLFTTSLVILMLLWHILRAKQMPQSTVWNQSGHCFFSRPGANNYSTASCAALLLQCLSYTLTSHSSALAWAVWHRIRLPVDTVPASPFFTFTLSLCLPINFHKTAPHPMGSIFIWDWHIWILNFDLFLRAIVTEKLYFSL